MHVDRATDNNTTACYVTHSNVDATCQIESPRAASYNLLLKSLIVHAPTEIWSDKASFCAGRGCGEAPNTTLQLFEGVLKCDAWAFWAAAMLGKQ